MTAEGSSSGDGARARMRRKYARMLELRETRSEAPPTRALRELAREFPGALRELDASPLEALRARAADLAQGGADAPWIAATDRYHALMRGALEAKRCLSAIGGGLDRAAFEREAGGAPDALAWAGDLAAIAAPPRGRLVPVVLARVARELGISEARARALALGG
ncbi:MAG: hypothetical protein JNL38_02585 [Myxococcales bacterium]|nr:hypothetical protein [Myxococcales bacterium]